METSVFKVMFLKSLTMNENNNKNSSGLWYIQNQ